MQGRNTKVAKTTKYPVSTWARTDTSANINDRTARRYAMNNNMGQIVDGKRLLTEREWMSLRKMILGS
jgi:hypothetical protein